MEATINEVSALEFVTNSSMKINNPLLNSDTVQVSENGHTTVPVKKLMPIRDPYVSFCGRCVPFHFFNLSKAKIKQLRKEVIRCFNGPEWCEIRKEKRKQYKHRKKHTKIVTFSSASSKRQVAIDFSYTHLMNARDIRRSIAQAERCYASNRIHEVPFKLHFCNFKGVVKETAMKISGRANWDVHYHEDSFMDVFDKSKIIYLTSESPNVLQELEDDMVYIIGGFVDHNAHKGLSYKNALKAGINHAQLPIKNYLQSLKTCVLPINHVFDILISVNNGYSWKETFLKVIPPRFYIKPKHEVSEMVLLNISDDDADGEKYCKRMKLIGASTSSPFDNNAATAAVTTTAAITPATVLYEEIPNAEIA